MPVVHKHTFFMILIIMLIPCNNLPSPFMYYKKVPHIVMKSF